MYYYDCWRLYSWCTVAVCFTSENLSNPFVQPLEKKSQITALSSVLFVTFNSLPWRAHKAENRNKILDWFQGRTKQDGKMVEVEVYKAIICTEAQQQGSSSGPCLKEAEVKTSGRHYVFTVTFNEKVPNAFNRESCCWQQTTNCWW